MDQRLVSCKSVSHSVSENYGVEHIQLNPDPFDMSSVVISEIDLNLSDIQLEEL